MGIYTDLVMLYPPSGIPVKGDPGSFCLPLGAAYIIAYLRQQGFNSQSFQSEGPLSVTGAVNRIMELKPRVVGFTVYQTNYSVSRLLTGAIKEADPSVTIIFGGPTPTTCAGTILKRNHGVDFCVMNEGEETALELMKTLAAHGYDRKKAAASFPGIKGIAYRAGNRVIKTSPRNTLYMNRETPHYLDKYPSPYLTSEAPTTGLGIIGARGCNQHCTYCSCSVQSKHSVATHSVERVIEELAHISNTYPPDRLVDILDDTFTLIPGRAHDICEKIIENKIKLPLICATRCDLVNETLMEKIREAGFIGIGFGLESAVPRILRRIGKVQPPNTADDPGFEKEKAFVNDFSRYVRHAKKIGFRYVYASIMLGLPGETPEDGQKTVQLVESLDDSLDYYYHNTLRVYPGTPLFHTSESAGIRLLPYESGVDFKAVLPYDTAQIPQAPKSLTQTAAIGRDKKTFKTLAFKTSGKPSHGERDFVEQIILLGDKITKEFVGWMHRYMAINGRLVHIYSSRQQAQENEWDNENALHKWITPTTNYLTYYSESTSHFPGEESLRPLRIHRLGEQCGLTIRLIDRSNAFSTDRSGPEQGHSVFVEREREDALALNSELASLSKEKSLAQHLMSRPFYPYISTLCRWEKAIPNCHSLEILLIDEAFNIKTCWNGEPIGKVSDPFEEIKAKPGDLHGETRHCLFPAPMSDSEYTILKEDQNVEDAANIIRSFDFLKE